MWVVSVIPAQAGIHAAKAGSLPRRALGRGPGRREIGRGIGVYRVPDGKGIGCHPRDLPLRPGEAPAEQREPDVGFAVQVMKRRLPVESDEALLRIDSETDGVRVDRGRSGEVRGNEREEKDADPESGLPQERQSTPATIEGGRFRWSVRDRIPSSDRNRPVGDLPGV